MDLAVIDEREVARVSGYEFILEGAGPARGDPGIAPGGSYILANLALLVEGAVRSLLVMAGDGRNVGDVHQFIRALVGENE